MTMISPLAKARGHGSAKSGTAHWFHQRASALALIPLTAWLLYAVICLAGAGYQQAVAFVASPFNSGALLFLIITVLYHGMLGLQVVIEDYVHHAGLELSLQLLVKAGAYGGMITSVILILKVVTGA
jgi:succinate dehydrogenase / fumarate reductase membrane anchor subunit